MTITNLLLFWTFKSLEKVVQFNFDNNIHFDCPLDRNIFSWGSTEIDIWNYVSEVVLKMQNFSPLTTVAKPCINRQKPFLYIGRIFEIFFVFLQPFPKYWKFHFVYSMHKLFWIVMKFTVHNPNNTKGC